MKVGIVTFNDAYNYGAYLQEYALQQHLKKNGIQVQVLNYQNAEFAQLYKWSNNPFRRAGIKQKIKILGNLVLRPSLYQKRRKKNQLFIRAISDEIELTPEFDNPETLDQSKFDFFISGSDQVWNVRMTSYNLYYLLNFVTDNSKKISYAGSFGRTEFDEADVQLFQRELGTFSSLLVREKSGQQLLTQKCGLRSEVVLDPTFLLNKSDWETFSKHSTSVAHPDKPYIVIYIVSKPTNLFDAALNFADKNGYEIVMLGRNSGIKHNGRYIRASIDVGPREFIGLLNGAEAIFTTSFHGTILSLNLGKRFYYELSKEKHNNNARIVDVVQKFGVADHEILSRKVDGELTTDWSFVNSRLKEERDISMTLLQKSLTDGGKKYE